MTGSTPVAGSGGGPALTVRTATAADVELQFYFPVAVGGKAAETIESLTAEYVARNPSVTIDAVYAGSYQDTVAKAITASRGGNPPQLSVILSVDMFTLIDEDLIIPFDDYLTTEEDKKWVEGFYPAFMENSQTGGKTYGIPFQRSTPVLYWNKEAFEAAGLDPDVAPATWAEMVEFGKKLTKKDADGNVTQWGVRIPSSGFPYWLFQGLAIENGAILANAEGNKTNFDDPKVVEALQYLVDLSTKDKVMAPGIIEWGATPKAFFEGQTAMMWHSTGNLTAVKNGAGFDFGVAELPAKERPGSPTGGGNFYVFEDTTDEERAAALKLIKFMTAPEQAAEWSIATGYMGVSPAAYETEALKAYTAEFPPALVARNQLENAVAEFSTFETARVRDGLNNAIQAALTGSQSPADALAEAQAAAERLLKDYR